MRKLLTILILIIIAAVCLAGCGNVASKAEKYTADFYDVFDTAVSITAYCESKEEFDALADEIHSTLLNFHRLFDIYNNYEGIVNIKTVNDLAGQEPVVITWDLMEILLASKEMYGLTDGNVNIAMGSVLRLWHEARETSLDDPSKAYVPSDADLKEAAKHCNIDDIVIELYDRSEQSSAASASAEWQYAGTVRLLDPEMSIDLGAVAKGWAVEKTAQNLEAEGHTSVLISAGGNVRAVGTKPDGEKWTVAIQDPAGNSQNGYASIVKVSDMSVVTSGGYQRYYEYNGTRYHHIIDKDSLKPENRYLSVSIITKDSGRADALSTAVFNMSFDDGLAFIESLEDTEALWIFPDGTQQHSSGF